jgi:hypothetical protein
MSLIDTETRARVAADEGTAQRISSLHWQLSEALSTYSQSAREAAASASIVPPQRALTHASAPIDLSAITALRTAIDSEVDGRLRAQSRIEDSIARLSARARDDVTELRVSIEAMMSATSAAVAELALKVRDHSSRIAQLTTGAESNAASLEGFKAALVASQNGTVQRLEALETEIR